jgi:hypothetical protein
MESSLSLQLSDFASEIGQFLGFGRTASLWTGWNAAGVPYVPQNLTVANQTVGAQDTQLGQIMAVLQAGLRQFYYPKLGAPTDPVAHKWSFMTVQRTLAVVQGQSTYDLPDDYNGLQGEFTFQPTDSTYLTCKRCGIGQIERLLQQLMGVTDKPTACAIYMKQSDGAMGQRWAISFAPLPDAAYTLTYTSDILPHALSSTKPWPLGGAAHGETILESCLAVAESRFNDESPAGGNHQAKFSERLTASIAADIRDNRPAYMGYNGDNSDMREQGGFAPWNNYPTQTVGALFNGVQY